MIKNRELELLFEHHDEIIMLKTGKRFQLKWKLKVMKYLTCGTNNSVIECLDLLPKTLSIQQQNNERSFGAFLSVDEFNKLNREEQLDLRCNCHGFTIANGKHWIADSHVDEILKDEFEEVLDEIEVMEGDYDILCFQDILSQEWIHSCKYVYELFLHKEGVRKFTVHATKEEVISIPEYSNATVHYFRRKQRSCPGICLNAKGEKYTKTFGNQAAWYNTMTN